MKKTAKIFILILIAVTALSLLLAGCDWFGKLEAPSLEFNSSNNTVFWSPVQNASSYRLTHNDGAVKRLETTEYTITSSGTHTIEVYAVGSSESKTSKTSTITVTVQQVSSGVSVAGGPIKAGQPEVRHWSKSGSDLAFEVDTQEALTSLTAYGIAEGQYSFQNKILTFKNSYLSQFSAGAVIPVEAEFETFTRKYNVSVIKAGITVPVPQGEFSDYEYEINKAELSAGGIVIPFGSVISVAPGISVNGILGKTKSDDGKTVYVDIADTDTASTVTLSEQFVSLLPTGRNIFQLHWEHGDITVVLNVFDTSPKVVDFRTDIDVPGAGVKAMLKWGYDYKEENGQGIDFYVTIAGSTLSTADGTLSVAKTENGEWVADITGAEGLSAEALQVAELMIKADNQNLLAEPVKTGVKLASAYTEGFIDNTYEFLGKTYNHYISSSEEFTAMVHRMYMQYPELDTKTFTYQGASKKCGYMTVYVSKTVFSGGVFSNEAFKDLFDYAHKTYPEAGKLNYYYEPKNHDGGTELTLGLDLISAPNPITEEQFKQSADYNKHLSAAKLPAKMAGYYGYGGLFARSDDFNGFAINQRPAARVSSSDELVYVIEAGFRPDFSHKSTSSGALLANIGRAESLYGKILDVMREIADDSMTDYEKVIAIYEWLTTEISYDNYAADASVGISSSSPAYDRFYTMRCFFLEGVFEDKLAVCNGYAKAFSVMCGIEGIGAYKVNGKSGVQYNDKEEYESGKRPYNDEYDSDGKLIVGVRGGEHAWNKVEIYGNWYTVDTTHGASGYGSYHNMTHNYLLFSSEEEKALDKRVDSPNQAVNEVFCNEPGFNPYANQLFVVDGKVYDFVIKDDYEINVFLSYFEAKLKSGLSGFSIAFYGESPAERSALQSSFKTAAQAKNIDITAKSVVQPSRYPYCYEVQFEISLF